MKYMVSWKITQDKWLPVMTKFGSLTRKERADAGTGVKIIGRWHDTTARKGVLIVQSNDYAAVSRYLGQWNPHMDLEVAPVLDDNEAATLCRRIIADNKA